MTPAEDNVLMYCQTKQLYFRRNKSLETILAAILKNKGIRKLDRNPGMEKLEHSS